MLLQHKYFSVSQSSTTPKNKQEHWNQIQSDIYFEKARNLNMGELGFLSWSTSTPKKNPDLGVSAQSIQL